jgi:hypothetical protein
MDSQKSPSRYAKMDYKNLEVKHYGKGRKTVRKVDIKGGKGKKTVMHYKNGKCCGKMTKPIKDDHVKMICGGIFVKGLFNDCVPKKNVTRKRK